MQKWTEIFSEYIHNLESADAAHDASHVNTPLLLTVIQRILPLSL